MKKYIFLMIIISLLFTAGCGKKTDNTEVLSDNTAKESTDSNTNTTEDLQQKEDASSLENLVGEAFTIVSEDNAEYSYEYHIPKVLLDSKSAQEINNSIMADCDDVINMSEDEKEFPSWWEIKYDAYLNNDILSIVITRRSMMDDYTQNLTYNMFLNSDEVVTNRKLQELSGFSDEEIKMAYKKAVMAEVDSNIRNYFEFFCSEENNNTEEEKISMFVDYLKCRQDAFSDISKYNEKPVYLDKEGNLTIIGDIFIPAGGGVYTSPIILNKDNNSKPININIENSFFFDYNNDRMTIRIDNTSYSNDHFDCSNIVFGNTYEVENITKDYVEGRSVVAGESNSPYIILLSDDGMISYIDLQSCTEAGYFCVTEPLFGFYDVKSLESVEEQVKNRLQNPLYNEYKIMTRSLMGLYDAEEGLECETYHTTASGGGYLSNYYMGFDSEEKDKFVFQDNTYDVGIYLSWFGTCNYLGMCEKGIIYNYNLKEESASSYGSPFSGAFSLRNGYEEENDDWINYKELTILGGRDLFDSLGEPKRLTPSYG